MKKLYLITGFLGAGKTTFLNELFTGFKDEKIAVIVNEYGQAGVDGKILSEKGIEVAEITNGSIFCVCRSDLFMEALNEAYKTNSDTIIVETSGLSDPLSSDEILEKTKEVFHCEFDFKGIISLIDAKNFLKVYKTAIAVENQVKSADLFIVNKLDLATEEQILQCESILTQLNPTSEIIKTRYSKVEDFSKIRNLQHRLKSGGIKIKDLLNQKITVEFDQIVHLEKMKFWLNSFKEQTYRIKGFVATNEGDFLIEAVGADIVFEKTETKIEKSFLVILYHANEKIKEIIKNNEIILDK